MGGETGPDLTRSKTVLADVNGDKISEVVRNGRPEKKMPAFNFSAPELEGLAAFIHGQVAAAAANKGGRRGVDVADLQAGNAEAWLQKSSLPRSIPLPAIASGRMSSSRENSTTCSIRPLPPSRESPSASQSGLPIKGFTHSLVHVRHLHDWLDHRIQATPKSAGTGNTVTAIPTSLTIAGVIGASGESTADRLRRPAALARNHRIMASSALGALPPANLGSPPISMSQTPCRGSRRSRSSVLRVPAV